MKKNVLIAGPALVLGLLVSTAGCAPATEPTDSAPIIGEGA